MPSRIDKILITQIWMMPQSGVANERSRQDCDPTQDYRERR